MKYLLTIDAETVEISMSTSDPNEIGAIAYKGSDRAVAIARDFISNSYGAFGHLITDSTSAIDLDYALNHHLAILQPVLIEGDRPSSYDPEIPQGAVT